MQPIFPATAERLEAWKAQPGVMGVLLVGSKSRGHDDTLSDDDLEVLLSDEAFARLVPADCGEFAFEGEGSERRLIYDVQYTALSSLERKRYSPHDLDRWPYERAGVLFDRDGRVGAAVEAAGAMDGAFRHARLLHATIDAWVAPRRAAKTLRRGADCAGRMIVARGAKALARVLFALEWRWVPLDHWLEAELRTLDDGAQAGPLLCQALISADPAPLEQALNRLEDRLFAEGVPRADDRRALFYELLHPSRAEERAIHGLY
ncbi:MAG TPA: hypothetical protein VFZ66_03765 [Herpetosiphonaceae bacterium]